jgi:hypothetical protein
MAVQSIRIVSEILILLKPSISQIYLKLQRLAVQSIRNSDTFEILYMWNILKTAETDSPKYQNCIRNSDTFETLYISNILKTAETGSPKYQNCIRNCDTFETLYISNILKTAKTGAVQSIRNSDTFETLYMWNILKTAETDSPKYQKFWYFWNPLYLKYFSFGFVPKIHLMTSYPETLTVKKLIKTRFFTVKNKDILHFFLEWPKYYTYQKLHLRLVAL